MASSVDRAWFRPSVQDRPGWYEWSTRTEVGLAVAWLCPLVIEELLAGSATQSNRLSRRAIRAQERKNEWLFIPFRLSLCGWG